MLSKLTSTRTNFSVASLTTITASNASELCFILRPIGFYFIVLWIAGIMLNGVALYALIRNRILRQSSTNLLVGGMLFADLIGSCFELPLPTFSLLHCRWLFGYTGCVFEATLVYFAGCSNMYMLCLISIDRYRTIMNRFSKQTINTKQIYLFIGGAYSLSLFWTMAPFAGWSAYDYEGIGISCSIQWMGRSSNVISYNVTIFIFVYLIPIVVIVVTNVKIYLSIRSRWHGALRSLNKTCIRHRCKAERYVLHTIILIVGGFLVTWTPYAVVVLVRICFNTNYFPPIVDTIPALFAKSSLVWNPLIYTMRNAHFRSYIPFVSTDSPFRS